MVKGKTLAATSVALWAALCLARSAKPAEAGPAKPITLDLGGNVEMKLVRVPAGAFLMGSADSAKRRHRRERPQHRVTIARDFFMGCCEVTRGQFAAFARGARYKTEPEKAGWAFAWDGKKWDKVNGASWKNVGFAQTDDHPVICVSWYDAAAFCRWLDQKTGRTARLPTEAEWEYACRAGTKTAYAWGDDLNAGKGWCNAADLTGRKRFRGWTTFAWEDGYVFTSPVGRFKANAFGLHDMHGNAWEWCGDWYAKNYDRAGGVDPRGPASGTLRAVRGGSWMSSPSRCRSAFRAGSAPPGSYCDLIVGFRVVVEVPRPTAPPKNRP